MTSESRLIIDLSDIRAIVFECRCGARVNTPFPADRNPRITECPSCGESWGFIPIEFLKALETQRNENDKGGPFRLRFELNGQPSA